MNAYPVVVVEYGEPILLVARIAQGDMIGDSSQDVSPGDIIFGKTYDEIFDSIASVGFVSF